MDTCPGAQLGVFPASRTPSLPRAFPKPRLRRGASPPLSLEFPRLDSSSLCARSVSSSGTELFPCAQPAELLLCGSLPLTVLPLHLLPPQLPLLRAPPLASVLALPVRRVQSSSAQRAVPARPGVRAVELRPVRSLVPRPTIPARSSLPQPASSFQLGSAHRA
jgi:hypothetical protein